MLVSTEKKLFVNLKTFFFFFFTRKTSPQRSSIILKTKLKLNSFKNLCSPRLIIVVEAVLSAI